MVNSPIKAEDLATEFSVVRNEFEMGENSPERVLSQRMTAVAYEWHNYGKSTIGNRSDIERVPVDNLRAFYKKFYQPDNAMLVVAGKFDEKKALEYITKYFGALPQARPQAARDLHRGAAPGRRAGGDAPPGRRRRPGRAALSRPGRPRTPSSPPWRCWPSILGSEPSGRLYKALVETKKATSVSASPAGPARSRACSRSWPRSTPRTRRPSRRSATRCYTVLDEVTQTGVTQEEVDRARQRMLKDRELAAADPNRIAVALSNWASQGDWRLYFLDRDRIEKVTPAQVKEVAAKYLTPSNRTVGFFIPTHQARADPGPAHARHRQARRGLQGPRGPVGGRSRSTSRPWPSRPASSGPSRSRASSSPSCPRRPAASPSTCT